MQKSKKQISHQEINSETYGSFMYAGIPVGVLAMALVWLSCSPRVALVWPAYRVLTSDIEHLCSASCGMSSWLQGQCVK